MTGTDMVFLRQEADSNVGQVVTAWPGDWPPPEQLFTVVLPDEQQMMLPAGARILRWERFSASEIPEPAGPDEHWFRGAQYVPASST